MDSVGQDSPIACSIPGSWSYTDFGSIGQSRVTVDERLLGSAAVVAARGPPVGWVCCLNMLTSPYMLLLELAGGRITLGKQICLYWVCKDTDLVSISTEGKVLTEPALHPNLH